MTLQESALLQSPFNTPIAQRRFTHWDSSPPLSSPLYRRRTPLGPSQLNSSPVSTRSESPFVIKKPMFHPPEPPKLLPLPRTTINDLPAELLQEIHLLSTNAHFPLTSRHVYHSLSHPSPTYAARWLLQLYAPYGYRTIIARAFKHRVVDLPVLMEMIRLWDERRGSIPKRGSLRAARAERANSEPSTPSRPRITRPALQLTEIPRRAVRLSQAGVSPLLEFIVQHFEASVNSHNGFPLQRAALDRNYELAEWLLRRGADPGLRDSLAVVAAVERRDLKMVKLLVEPFENGVSPSGLAKRRRVADRVSVGPNLVQKALTAGADDIVDYFVHEKGAMPPLGYIMGLAE